MLNYKVKSIVAGSVALVLLLGVLVVSGVVPIQVRVAFTSLSKNRDEPQVHSSVPEAARILLAQLARLEQNGGGSGMQEVSLHNSLGKIFQGAGDYSEASHHYVAARSIVAKEGGEKLVAIQATLGNAYLSAGKLKEARQELESAYLSMDRNGPNAFHVLWTLGNARREGGKLDEALVLYGKAQELHKQQQQQQQQRVLRRQEWTGSAQVDRNAGLLSDIGRAYHGKGQLESAISYFKQALEQYFADGERLAQVKTDADALELSQVYNRLGQALHDRGDVQSAAEHYQKALRLQQKSMPAGHPRIAETFMNMARNQRDSGEGFGTALATLDKAESLLKEHTSAPEYASLMSMKADILREEGRLEEAEEFARRALALQEQEGMEESPELAVTLNGLGSILHDQHNYKFAVKHYMRALSVNLKTVGTMHPETAATYNNLGNVYQDSGDDEAAERYYMKCLEIQKQLFDKQTPGPELAATYNNIATILARQERFQEAESLLSMAVDVVREAGLPSSSPDRAIYEDNLAEVKKHLRKDGSTVQKETFKDSVDLGHTVATTG